MAKEPKTFLSTKEVAELLDINEKVVYSLISEKGLPASKVTGKWIFPRHLVEKWIESHVVNYPSSEKAPISKEPLIIVGSNDLLLERTIALYNNIFKENGNLCVFGCTGSLGGLKALAKGTCHIATAHLIHSDEKDYNFAYIEENIDGPLPVVVNFCFREQGIIIKKENPKNIKDISSLAENNIVIANRPKGTGTRLLLDHELQKAQIEPQKIKGYEQEFPTHLSVAIEVLSGRVDAGLGIKAVASLLGLGFIPIRYERYDFLIPKDLFFERPVQRFLGLLQEEEFKRLSMTFEGYDITHTGRITYPRD